MTIELFQRSVSHSGDVERRVDVGATINGKVEVKVAQSDGMQNHGAQPR